MSFPSPEFIRLSRSVVDNRETDAVAQVISDGYLGMGHYVDKFESKIKEFLNTDNNVICVSSGTAALHLALQASGLGPGDQVLVPSITYLASYQAITACGAIPISCDVIPGTLFLDPDDSRSRITERTKAIMPVHYGSNVIGIDDIYNLANDFNLVVIEDAAHSFGNKKEGNYIGATEDIVCFSFDGIKNITTGEGGAVIVKSDSIAQHIKDARLLGVSGDTVARFSNSRSWHPTVAIQGWRYHMSNIFAAIGLVQLENCAERFRRRTELGCKYFQSFQSSPAINCLEFNYSSMVPHIFPVLLNPSVRNSVRKHLESLSIQTGIHYYPNHLLKRFKSSYVLPVSENAGNSLLSLPLHPLISDDQHNFIIDSLLDFFS